MKITIAALVAFLAASVAASPVEEHHHDLGSFGVGALMERAQGKRPHAKHKHTVADFRKKCDCPPAECPAGRITDKKSVSARDLMGAR